MILSKRRPRLLTLTLLIVAFVLIPALAFAQGQGNKKTNTERWFNPDRVNMLIAALVSYCLILYCIHHATRVRLPKMRRIGGVEAVEEAVGRATEMGRSVLFVPGIQDMDNVQTLAALNILGRVAQRVAEYETELKVPTCRSLVMSTAQEVTKEAFLRAGHPDAFRPDSVFYMTDDQFGYAAGINGIMLRERPATIFMMGAFYAESLLLAETGNRIGAIQIAGTAMPSQIPFFVAACDYTLIGEELFAASAYLAKEEKLLGSLRGQDMCKFLVMLFIVVGVLLELLICFDIIAPSWSIVSWFQAK